MSECIDMHLYTKKSDYKNGPTQISQSFVKGRGKKKKVKKCNKDMKKKAE